MESDVERETFERWAKTRSMSVTTHLTERNGYASNVTQMAWDAWQESSMTKRDPNFAMIKVRSCSNQMVVMGLPRPRSCARCGFSGPCVFEEFRPNYSSGAWKDHD